MANNQPGEALINQIFTRQLDGRQLGNQAFQFLPSMPHESPVPMPRFMARQIWPAGFIPKQVAPYRAPAEMVPPAGASPAVNQNRRTQTANQVAARPAANQGNQQPRPTRAGAGMIQSDPGRPKVIRPHIMQRERGVM